MTDALFQDASRAHQAGDLRTAHTLYHQILRANPRHFEALFSLGQLHFQCGQFEEATRFAGEAARCNPRSHEAWYVRGSALQRLDRHADALSAFARALSERPGFAEALVNRGASLMALKRPAEALKSFDAALAVDGNLAQAWNNRGNALSALGRSAEAIESYNRVLAMMPGMPEALINRGTAYQSLKRYREALESYDEAALLQPANADAFGGRGNALFELQDYEAAADAYQAALAADPDYKYAWGNFAFSRLHGCAWDGIETIQRETAMRLRAGKAAVNPFQAVALFGDDQDHLQCAQVWADDKYPSNPPLWTGQIYTHEKIRIAYISGDFRNHAVAKVIVGVLENHDRARIETIGVSFGPDDESPLRTRVMGAFDKIIDARELSDAETARLMRKFDIDIAVDLMGYTGDCRPGICSYRPAPIQVNFLGFPGTMGAEYFDYILADATVTPEDQRAFFREKVVHLPDTFMPWDSQQRIAAPPSRAAARLPNTGFVFASFNNTYKFGPEIFAIWMRLMARVPESVLWLHEGNPWAMRNLKAEAEKRGIARERLVFAPFAPIAEDHLARLGLADLFLDTLPYNAHATALDALSAGVPVLTTPGTSFASRVAASIVKAAGLSELIAPSLPEYESFALTIATDPALCGTFKARLARNKATAPLFDTRRFTRHLETAYVMMRERQRRGEAPVDFAVVEV